MKPDPTSTVDTPKPVILHLVTDLRLGGTQKILLERVRGGGGFRHEVLAFAATTASGRGAYPGDELETALRAAGAGIHLLGWEQPRAALAAWLTGRLDRAADRVVGATGPGLLHSTLFHSHLLGDRMARRHRLPHLAGKEGIDSWMGSIHRQLEGGVLRRADQVVAVSRATGRCAVELGVAESRVHVIPNGIDADHPGTWRVPAGDGPRLVGVGRLDRSKGWDDLLRAMAVLAGRRPDLRLHILGSGREEGSLRRRIRSLGLSGRAALHPGTGENVRRDEPPGDLIGQARATTAPVILVVPSREEGFGLVLLEGMARGLPIVATFAGGIPEVARDGREALLVPPGDPAALAGAIDRILTDPELAAALVRAGRERVRAFPVEAMVQDYHRLYRHLLGFRPDAFEESPSTPASPARRARSAGDPRSRRGPE